MRGKALGVVGGFHPKDIHNYYERFDRDSHEVTSMEASDYKVVRHGERTEIKREKAYYRIEEDPDWTFVTNRTFSTLIIFSIIGYWMAKNIYIREKFRLHQYKRHPDNLINAPAHHFINRGGVLLEKEFVGFAKYFKNDTELKEWYNKVYPDIMQGEGEKH